MSRINSLTPGGGGQESAEQISSCNMPRANVQSRNFAVAQRLPDLLYIGEVPVESSYHGSASLYRVLKGYPPEKLLIMERADRISRIERRLPAVKYTSVPSSWKHGAHFLRTRAGWLFWPTWKVLAASWANTALKRLGDFKVEAILSVHEGSLWLGAFSLAKRLGVPFHLILHDDWFRSVDMTKQLRSHLEGKFGSIYRAASGRFCVSPYMEEMFRQRYGAPGEVLYPSRLAKMRSYADPPAHSEADERPFTVAYAGSTLDGGYLEIMKAMAKVLQLLGGRLLLFGPFSCEEVRHSGLSLPNVMCCGLLEPTALIERFRREADALFVPMSFDDIDRDNMTAGFPSKLADYTVAGLPLIICGPPYCSAVRWARQNRGCCKIVENLDLHRLESAVRQLQTNSRLRSEMGADALRIGDKYFSHNVGETLFFSRLLDSTP